MQLEIKDPNDVDKSDGSVEDGEGSETNSDKEKAEGAFDSGISVDGEFDESTLSSDELEEF